MTARRVWQKGAPLLGILAAASLCTARALAALLVKMLEKRGFHAALLARAGKGW